MMNLTAPNDMPNALAMRILGLFLVIFSIIEVCFFFFRWVSYNYVVSLVLVALFMAFFATLVLAHGGVPFLLSFVASRDCTLRTGIISISIFYVVIIAQTNRYCWLYLFSHRHHHDSDWSLY